MTKEMLDKLCGDIKASGTDIILQLPCDRIAPLLGALSGMLPYISLTREEEGVGIAAGIALAGAKPLMIVQSSGMGNMVNAILSLTKFYDLPLPIFISHRGVYKENIAAQVPMGAGLAGVLEAMDVEFKLYNEHSQLDNIPEELEKTYRSNKINCFLISPKIFEGLPKMPLKTSKPISMVQAMPTPMRSSIDRSKTDLGQEGNQGEEILKDIKSPRSRLEVLEGLSEFLRDKAVLCNMGFPSRELYSVFDQDSNFYMLGSLSLVSSIGHGVSLFTKKDVVVLDGDGSLLMNPNALISIGALQPKNLTIICLDNGAYGSTGNQPTLTARGLKLEDFARASQIRNILVTDNTEDIYDHEMSCPNFVKLVIQPGNAKVGTIGLSPEQIKTRFQDWLQK